MMETLLQVDRLSIDLCQGQGWIPAVQDVSFTLQPGKTLGVIGESGSGKSLTCSALLGLLQPDKWRITGEIYLNGESLPYQDNREMRHFRGHSLALIMQNPISAFDPLVTIGKHFQETIALHRSVSRKEVLEQAESLLAQMYIKDPKTVLRSYPFQCSGGMLQRVMIALALVAEPEIIIADEPTTALDLTIQHEIIKLLEELQQKIGTAILLVSHDLGVIRHLADDLAVMYGGRIVEKGSLQDLLQQARHPYTKGLFASKPIFSKERLVVLEGQPCSLLERLQGCCFYPRCPKKVTACQQYDMTSFALNSEHEGSCYLLGRG